MSVASIMQAAIERSNLIRDKQVESIRDVSEATSERIAKSAVEMRVEQIGKAINAFKELTKTKPE